MDDGAGVTQWLDRLRDGDEDAVSKLIPLVYRELRVIAAAAMKRERPGHTLQPTAVVHEAFLRMVAGEHARTFENRAHFFAIAARTMRRVLVDHARRRLADKRGGEHQQVEISDALVLTLPQSTELLGLNDALDELNRLDPRQARIVEMHYFAGNAVAEIAFVLDISERTVKRELQTARMFLKQQLEPKGIALP